MKIRYAVLAGGALLAGAFAIAAPAIAGPGGGTACTYNRCYIQPTSTLTPVPRPAPSCGILRCYVTPGPRPTP